MPEHHVKTFQSIDELLDAYPAAEKISRRSNSYFSSLDWYDIFFQTALADDDVPLLKVIVDQDDQILAILPVLEDKSGKQVRSATNFYSIGYTPLLAQTDNHAAALLDRLLIGLCNQDPRPESVHLQYLNDGVVDLDRIIQTLKQADFLPHSYFQYENWYTQLDSDDNFDTYFSRLPSRVRNTINRKEKKLRKSHDVKISIVTSDEPELENAIRDYQIIYSNSWKKPEPFRDFIPSLIRRCSKLGYLRLGLIYIDEIPAAAQIWITKNRKSMIYKLAYQKQFSRYSPGSILSRSLFQYAIESDCVEEIDYGVGSESYKREWMDRVRQIHGVSAHNIRTFRGALRGSVQLCKTTARKVLRR